MSHQRSFGAEQSGESFDHARSDMCEIARNRLARNCADLAASGFSGSRQGGEKDA
jgi:hypothetical protein